MGKDGIRYLKKRMMKMALTPFRILPIINNQVLMINDLGYNYSCNPRFITDYLINHYAGEFKIVYSVKNPDNYKDAGLPVTFVKFNSLRYFVSALTSKVIVSNSGGYSYLPHRKKQVVINTHHGGGAYKKAGLDMFGDTYWFRKDMELFSKATDIFLSTNHKFTEVISKATLVPQNRFWEIGMPRNDLLIEKGNDSANDIKRKIGLKDNEKLVLYAPTYRKPEDNYYQESIAVQYGIDPKTVCEALEERFGGTWKFGLRLHPCITNKDEYKLDCVVDLSEFEDMQDLLLAADVMINDFSSSMWDFMLTGRPCFLFAVDKDHYIETTEVYTPVSEWPFPFATSNQELKALILNFDEKQYAEDCKQHYAKLGGCESGQATKLVAEKIHDICFGTR